jgi:hypothetical protein
MYKILAILLAFVFFSAGKSHCIELSAVAQMLAAKTLCNEAAGEPMKGQEAVARVMMLRALLSGESLETVLRIPSQFAGASLPWRSSPERMVESLNIIADVWESGDYGVYTHFWPVYRMSGGKKVKNNMPRWWTGSRHRIGDHWFGTMPFRTSTKTGMRQALSMLAEHSKELAEFIFPERKTNTAYSVAAK